MSRYIVNGEVYIEHRFLKKTIKLKMVNLLFYHRMHQLKMGQKCIMQQERK